MAKRMTLVFPKFTCKELLEDKWEELTKEWSNAKYSLSFYKTDKDEYKCFFTDMGEEEFLMMCVFVNRHIELFNLLKLVIMDVEKMRQKPCVEHDFTYKALEYIKLKKLRNPSLEIK